MRFHSLFLQFKSGTQDGTRLHLSDFRIGIAQTAATVTQHRIVFAKGFHTLLDVLQTYTHGFGHLLLSLQIMRYKLVQRRVEQTNGNRIAGHSLEDALEVGLLIRQNLVQSLTAAFCIFCQNHFAHGFDLLTFEEHVLRTAQTDTYGTKATGHRSIVRRIGIGTHLQLRIFVGQVHQFGKVTGKFGSFRFNLSLVHFTRTAVQRNEIAFLQNNAVHLYGTGLIVNIQCACTRNTALTHATGYNGCMRSHATAGRQNAFGHSHTCQVFG